MKKANWTVILAVTLSVIGTVLIITFALDRSFNDGSGVINPMLASQFGSFIGGLVGSFFSLAGILLIYETISRQRDSFRIQQFENKFFEMIRYHRDNVAQMTYKLPDRGGDPVKDHWAFYHMKRQFDEMFNEIEKLVSDQIIGDLQIDDIVKIAYVMFFFGVEYDFTETVINYLKHPKKDIVKIINKLHESKTVYNKEIVKYAGHQRRLAHYFRHVYQTVKLVDEFQYITDLKKYDYVKILRAQFSQFELAIHLLNSLSPMGKKWNDKGWIVKYQLIKNLPENIIHGIDPKKYYPRIQFEW
jgi:hypothetical protein